MGLKINIYKMLIFAQGLFWVDFVIKAAEYAMPHDTPRYLPSLAAATITTAASFVLVGLIFLIDRRFPAEIAHDTLRPNPAMRLHELPRQT